MQADRLDSSAADEDVSGRGSVRGDDGAAANDQVGMGAHAGSPSHPTIAAQGFSNAPARRREARLHILMEIEVPLPDPKRGLTTLLKIEPKLRLNPAEKK